MKSPNLEQIDFSSYLFFFIQGRGLQFISEITEILSSNENKFDIMMILNHEKKLYGYNFFSYLKLKPEIKNLLKKSKKGMFVFIKCKNMNYMIQGDNQKDYIENQIIFKYEKIIRNRFDLNENNNNKNHIIYGFSDGLSVHFILKYFGYNKGVQIFDRHKNKPFEIPYYLEDFNKCKIHEINVSDLICNTLLKSSINIKESPHYKFLQGSETVYKNYIEKYLGYKITAYQSLKKYKELSKNFEYLSKNNETSYVIVKKVNNKYMVLDGLHRASLSIYKRKSKLIVLEVL